MIQALFAIIYDGVVQFGVQKRKNNSKKSSLHVKIILHVFSLSYLPFYLTRLSQQPF
jgi:hypothetical protein